MTKEEIIRMANKAAMQSETFVHHGFDSVFLERFANLVAAAKCEEIEPELLKLKEAVCANIADPEALFDRFRNAIRARSQS